jgi:hypothetical protein
MAISSSNAGALVTRKHQDVASAAIPRRHYQPKTPIFGKVKRLALYLDLRTFNSVSRHVGG